MDQELALPQVSTGSFSFRTVDSRGHETLLTVNLPLIPYIPLTALATAKRIGATAPEAELAVRGAWFSGSFGAADNTLQLRMRVGNGDWQPLTPVPEANGYTASALLSELDYRQAHTITIEASDRLDQVTLPVTLLRGIPVFDWGESDFTFHVPVRFQGGLEGIYPVGSVYISVSDTDPGTLFGGTWERLKDRFLLAAGDTYTPGTTGAVQLATGQTSNVPHYTAVYMWIRRN
jgi:hypothetical protein